MPRMEKIANMVEAIAFEREFNRMTGEGLSDKTARYRAFAWGRLVAHHYRTAVAEHDAAKRAQFEEHF